jgi:hypothetical protein
MPSANARRVNDLLGRFQQTYKKGGLEMKKQQIIVLKYFLIFAAGLFMSACTNQESTLKNSNYIGDYILVSVNGNPVPANITHQGVGLKVRSGVFTINGDGTCSTKTVFVPPSGTDIAREVSATYTKEGSKLNMQWKGAGTTVGTIQDNTFTMDNEGLVFVYKK